MRDWLRREQIDITFPFRQSFSKKEVIDIVSVRVQLRIKRSLVIEHEKDTDGQKKKDMKDFPSLIVNPGLLICFRDILFRC